MDEIYFFIGGQRGDMPFCTCSTVRAFRFLMECLGANDDIIPDRGKLALVSFLNNSDFQSGHAMLRKEGRQFKFEYVQGALSSIIEESGLLFINSER